MAEYKSLIESVARSEQQMFALLRRMVLTQSGSHNKKGVDAIAALIRHALEGSCLKIDIIRREDYGDHLLASTPRASSGNRGILIVGHTDTVFPADTPFNWYREDEQHAYGPGIVDMKAGLVAGIFALKALEEQSLLDDIPIRFLFNSDEEIGSPSSARLIEQLAEKSFCAFVLECGGLEGGIVTGRKGRIGLQLDIEGEAGHAAFAGREKPSAVLELCHKTIALEALNGFAEGVTLNVGKIAGGIGPNTVAQQASAWIDIRYVEPGQKPKIWEQVERIAEKSWISGTQGRLSVSSERPPMPQTKGNKELFRTVQDIAKALNVEVTEEYRSGVSDANLIAARNVPVLDGLGPVGALDHSEKEYMLKHSLVERTKLFTLTLVEAWKRFSSLFLL